MNRPKENTEDDSSSSLAGPVTVAVLFGGALLLLILALFGNKKSNNADDPSLEEQAEEIVKGKGKKVKSESAAAAAEKEREQRRAAAGQNQKGKAKDTFAHPLLVTTLRGHTGEICDGDFSANGKYFVTSSEDRSVHIWTCADFLSDDPAKEIRHSRLNMDYDHAVLVRFSPDSKALLGRMNNDNVVRVLKLNKKPDGHYAGLQTVLDLPTTSHGEIVFMDINCNGKFIMTGYADTQICLWSLKGNLLATIVTNVATLHCAKVSPCGRFVAASGFTPDVKVWEVNFEKSSGDFHSVERAFELKGHSAGIPCFAFSGDSTHMVSLSKDKTFRLYDINVEYKKKQDARLIQDAIWTTEDVDVTSTQVALSNDSRCIVIATKGNVSILSGVDGSVKAVIQSPLTGPIQKLMLDPSSGYIITIGGRLVRVFRNTIGYEITIATLKDKLTYATQDSISQRLQQQLEDTQKVLSACKYHLTA
ncbi:Transducin beta-like protein 2 [Hypsibius exemplaris]|uniref:Transducin beta-like protein 2 n=1 Tax=Hypsibius exemplaris TaxID=2072580 RepID=A0A1W0WQL4_HYPEX|nr:Transducin beta-like protein 2 [Hypsibius exemplaris]